MAYALNTQRATINSGSVTALTDYLLGTFSVPYKDEGTGYYPNNLFKITVDYYASSSGAQPVVNAELYVTQYYTSASTEFEWELLPSTTDIGTTGYQYWISSSIQIARYGHLIASDQNGITREFNISLLSTGTDPDNAANILMEIYARTPDRNIIIDAPGSLIADTYAYNIIQI